MERTTNKKTSVLHACFNIGRQTHFVDTNKKHTFRFAGTLDASDSIAGTDQSAPQIRPFPLVIDIIEVAILYATI